MYYLKIFLFLVLFPNFLFAGELRIVDFNGLTRAVKKIENQVNVRVVFLKQPNNTLKLIPESKMLPEISVEPMSKEVVFLDVKSGTWKIGKTEDKLKIKSVKILN